VIVEQTHFYHQDPGVIYQILLTLSTQILGYTFAGLTRQWLVRPSSMIWPGTLMSTAMFTTLHDEENKPADGWKVSRWRFFVSSILHGYLVICISLSDHLINTFRNFLDLLTTTQRIIFSSGASYGTSSQAS